MTSSIFLFSAGTSYYLTNGGQAQSFYSGSGTPWTAIATTPYQIAMNTTDGAPWTPAVAPRQEIYGGSPPFRNGRRPLYNSFDNVSESIGVQMYATSHDNAVALIRQLRQILNTALITVPCLLAVQPDGATNTVYYEIYGAEVQENYRFINDEAGGFQAPQSKGILRTTIHWRRSFMGGIISTGETLISAATFTNTGTGGSNNVTAYSAGSGEMIYEGGPLNIKITPTNTGGDTVSPIWMASVSSRTYSTTGAGACTAVAGVSNGTATLAQWDVTTALTLRGVKPRVMLRVTSSTANAQLRINVNPLTLRSYYSSPWIAIGTTGTCLIDMGTFSLDSLIRPSKGFTTQKLVMQLEVKTTDGSNATVTLTYSEYLLYYEFCRTDHLLLSSTGSTRYLLVDQFQEQTNFVCLPHYPAQGYVADTSISPTNTPQEMATRSGTFPRYHSGASLYLAWLTDGSHSTTKAATVTATHGPLYGSFRGAG